MLKLIALPDLHGAAGVLEAIGAALRAVDCVVLPGDLTTNGDASAVQAVVDEVRRYNQHLLMVPGNWDGPAVRAWMDREGLNLDGAAVTVGPVVFVGVGGALPTPGHTPYERPEAAFASALEAAEAAGTLGLPRVLISHQPPLNTRNDLTSGGAHVGSSAVRAWIERHQPLLCLTGHIHEGSGLDHIGSTAILNPGPAWSGTYPYVEIDAGALVTAEIRRHQRICSG